MVSIDAARDFVYRHGDLWERSLFGHLIDGRPNEEVRRALEAFKNPDGGFGHGLEHDLRSPNSNPAQLELLLIVNRSLGLEVKPLLGGTVAWLESVQEEDGSLGNPTTLDRHPSAPWWTEWGGQRVPESIVGNLARLGLATPRLLDRSRAWVEANVTLDAIRETEWLFMLYRPVDYFYGLTDDNDLDAYREVTAETLVALAAAAPPEQYGTLLGLLTHPDLVPHVPEQLIDRDLDHLERGQQPGGNWQDQHQLTQWYPLTTISNLVYLKRYGRL